MVYAELASPYAAEKGRLNVGVDPEVDLSTSGAHEHFNPTNLDFPLPRTCWTQLQPVLRVSTMEQTDHHLDSAAAAAMAAEMDTIANALNLRSTPTPAIAPTPAPAPTVVPAPTPSPVPTAATAPMASSSPHATVPTASGNLVRWLHLFLLSEVISFSALHYLIILSFITIFTRIHAQPHNSPAA
jgi:hypothetical protein